VLFSRTRGGGGVIALPLMQHEASWSAISLVDSVDMVSLCYLIITLNTLVAVEPVSGVTWCYVVLWKRPSRGNV
jgi:hypothetical protein